METLSLIVMAVGSWVLVISLIIVLGKLRIQLETPSHELLQGNVQDTDTVVSLPRAEELVTEENKADSVLQSAA